MTRFSIQLPASKRDLGALSAVQAGNYLVPLLLVPFYARVLGQQNWGYLGAALGVSIIVQSLVEYGFQYSLAVEVARDPSDLQAKGALVARVVASRLTIGAAAAVVAIFFAPQLEKATGGPLNLFLAVAAGALLGCNFMWLMRPLGFVSTNAGIDTAWRILGALVTVALVRGSAGITAALAIQLTSALGNITTQAVAAHKRIPFHFVRVTAAEVYRTLVDGASMAAVVISVLAYTSANVVLVGLLSGPAAAGAYAGAEKLAKAGSGLLDPLIQATFGTSARLASLDRAAAAAHVRAVVRMSLLLGTCLSLALLTGGRLLIGVVLGAGYHDTVVPLLVLAPLPILIALSNPLSLQWLVPTNKGRTLAAIIALGGLINVGLAFLLCPGLAATGMALAVILSETTVTALVIAAVARRRPSPLEYVLRWKTVELSTARLPDSP